MCWSRSVSTGLFEATTNLVEPSFITIRLGMQRIGKLSMNNMPSIFDLNLLDYFVLVCCFVLNK